MAAWKQVSRSMGNAVEMLVDRMSLVTFIYPVITPARDDDGVLPEPEPEPEPEPTARRRRKACLLPPGFDLITVRHYIAGTGASILVNGKEVAQTSELINAHQVFDMPFDWVSRNGVFHSANLRIAEADSMSHPFVRSATIQRQF